jgi:hypothetical protein
LAAFFTDLYDSDTQPPNMARFQVLDPAARRFYPDWALIADMTVDASAATAPAPHASTTRSLTLRRSPAPPLLLDRLPDPDGGPGRRTGRGRLTATAGRRPI